MPWDDGRFILEEELHSLLYDLGCMPFVSALQETERTLLSTNRLTPRLKAVKRSLLVGPDENQYSRMSKCIDFKTAKQCFPSLERKGVFLDLLLQYVIIDKMVRAINDCSTDEGHLSDAPKHRRRHIYTNKFKGWAPLHDWVKVITRFKERFIQMSANFDLSREASQQSIELDLMQSLSSNISRSRAHVALANVEAAALCLRLIWKTTAKCY
ncbi:hypothetical protein K443DRAFT_15847 [Laccaria amethystina LaAM-08-1]|uniref:Uncharacterized protein n=1 Tax=Laccaria amethystina LaAM-08-1 TaxID=1095629 RepID=A0A0C9WZ81_9AGAR|nr:hypothetical protein K443DRAFT_15847 [Laccaria amethystina LaAM-08-1]